LEEHPNEKQKSSCQTISKLRIQSKWWLNLSVNVLSK
jgi:hypothetical protein